MASRNNLAAPTSVGYLARLLKRGRIFDRKHNQVKARSLIGVLGKGPRIDTSDATMRPGPDNIGGDECSEQTPSEAALRVLNTPELLEMILLCLQFGDLAFDCALVCRAFRDVINESPTIQRCLFRAPDHDSPLQKFPFDIKGIRICMDPNLRNIVAYRWGIFSRFIEVDADMIDATAGRSKALRKSFVTQPPTRHLPIVYRYDKRVPENRANIDKAAGVTFGHVFDFIEQVRPDDGLGEWYYM